MDTELKKITPNGNKGAAYLCDENVTASNGEGQGAPEREGLLFTQPISHNGGAEPFDCEAAVEKPKNTHPSQEESAMFRIKRELNEFVFWKIRLWMIIVFIFLLIVAVLLISLAVCSAIHKDEDENFDLSLFKVPLYFNGSFELPGKVFTDEPSTPYSNESQALVDGLKEKLTDLYKTSPALGRYFSKADVYIFRKGSDIADYQLTFLLPEEELDQLRNFTLSREMVFNIFRQFLYDQKRNKTDPMYIYPPSLKMFLIP